MIHPAQRHEKGNDDGRRGGQPSDRQLALDHCAHAHRKRMLLRQHQRRPAKMIRPVAHLLLLDRTNVKLRPLRKVQRAEFDDSVLLRTVGDMDSLIDPSPWIFPYWWSMWAPSGEILYGQNTSHRQVSSDITAHRFLNNSCLLILPSQYISFIKFCHNCLSTSE